MGSTRCVLEGASGCGSKWGRSRTRDACVWILATKSALGVDAVSPAAELSHFARSVPIVGYERLVCEPATGRWARYADVGASSTKATSPVLPIRVTSEHAHFARWVPKVAWKDWLVIEGALSVLWDTSYPRRSARDRVRCGPYCRQEACACRNSPRL